MEKRGAKVSLVDRHRSVKDFSAITLWSAIQKFPLSSTLCKKTKNFVSDSSDSISGSEVVTVKKINVTSYFLFFLTSF
jgi:hypothetical protein